MKRPVVSVEERGNVEPLYESYYPGLLLQGLGESIN